MGETVDLYAERDSHGGSRCVWLHRRDDGSLVLEGQDLGGAVTEFWGSAFTEYEWDWSLPADRVSTFFEELGIAQDAALEDVAERLKQLDRAELQQRFKDAGAEFWSRVGD
jgi:hypothetical protein